MEARDVAAEVFEASFPDVCRYVDILADRGISWGLLGPREIPRLWDRHILNSVVLASVVRKNAFVIDVGSGAGLPGIPLALARPDLIVTLLEPLARRAQFLEAAVAELGLGARVRVVRERAEDHDEIYDVVTCRAVAGLGKLLEWCTPLLDVHGELIALKGERVHAEVEAAATQLAAAGLRAEVRQVSAHPEAEPTFVAVVKASASV